MSRREQGAYKSQRHALLFLARRREAKKLLPYADRKFNHAA
jgi:hypothetical protein